MIVTGSVIIVSIQVCRQDCVARNHNVDVLKLVARARTIKSIVEKSRIHICPKGIVESVRKMLFRNFRRSLQDVEEAQLQMIWEGLKQTNLQSRKLRPVVKIRTVPR